MSPEQEKENDNIAASTLSLSDSSMNSSAACADEMHTSMFWNVSFAIDCEVEGGVLCKAL